MDRRTGSAVLTLLQLCERYLAHAKVYYRGADGEPTREHLNIEASQKWLREIMGDDVPASALTKHDVRAVQAAMIREGRTRTYINSTIGRLRRMYLWAMQTDLVEDTPDDPAAARCMGAFSATPSLKKNRSLAWENPPVEGVDLKHVAATLPFMPANAAAIVRIVVRTAARVAEIRRLRVGDVKQDTDGTWWAYPRQHKTRWRGHERPIPLDAECMKIIQAQTPRTLFDVAIDPQTPLFPARTRKPYTKDGLRTTMDRSIARAKAAGVEVPHWTMHQIRHTVAVLARRAVGLDDTQALLGHQTRKMTEHYAGCDNPQGARRAQRAVSRRIRKAVG